VSGTAALAPLGNRVRDEDPSFVHWPLPNVWMGVSVEDQKRANERVPDLLTTPAVVRFLSCEPLLGPVDVRQIRNAGEPGGPLNALTGYQALTSAGGQGVGYYFAQDDEAVPRLDWVIVGGESGPGSRPMHPDWARGLREQCAAAGVPMLFKQWGDWVLSPSPEATMAVRPDQRDFMDLAGWQNAMIRVGKRAAGRLLDGVQHDGMPS
jgi:protein gp37